MAARYSAPVLSIGPRSAIRLSKYLFNIAMLRIFVHPVNYDRCSGGSPSPGAGKRPQALGCAIATEPQRLPAMHRHASMKPAGKCGTALLADEDADGM